MPNADTKGNLIREIFTKLAEENKNILGVENFGTRGYFSCMKYCSFLLGNTSSGIIEAASFGKYVINIGDRQAGRARSKNTLDTAINKKSILKLANKISLAPNFSGKNIYVKKNTASTIINILKKISL